MAAVAFMACMSRETQTEFEPPKLTARIEDTESFRRFKGKLALRNESIKDWCERMVKLELSGKLPPPPKL